MSSRLATATLLALMAPALTLPAGCGGSSHTGPGASAGSTSTAASASTSTAASASTNTAAGASTTAATAGATPASTTTATISNQGRPPEVPRRRARQLPHSRPVAPDTNVRIPAIFTILRGSGQLVPPLISVPSGITVNLRLRNDDLRAHTVQLDAPHRYIVRLAGGRSADTPIPGLPTATYRLLIDGSVRGRIVVGSVPGP